MADLINVTVTEALLSQIIDAFSNAPKAVLNFTAHELRVEADDNSKHSMMNAIMTKHCFNEWSVTQPIRVEVLTKMLARFCNTKVFKSSVKRSANKKSPVVRSHLNLKITKDQPGNLVVTQKHENMTCENTLYLDYNTTINSFIHDYSPFCGRTISSTSMKDFCSFLQSLGHRLCHLKVDANGLELIGNKTSNTKIFIKSLDHKNVDDAATENEYENFVGEGDFSVEYLKKYTKAASLSNELQIYLENDKPLLIEFPLRTADSRCITNAKDCEDCKKLELEYDSETEKIEFGLLQYTVLPGVKPQPKAQKVTN